MQCNWSYVGNIERLCNIFCDFQNLENILCKWDNIAQYPVSWSLVVVQTNFLNYCHGWQESRKRTVVEFIVVYRGLWDVKCKDYSNRAKFHSTCWLWNSCRDCLHNVVVGLRLCSRLYNIGYFCPRNLSKNLKIKIYKTILVILPILLHGCETWSQ